MDADERDDLFGRIALEKEYITDEELADAREAKRHLVELGIADKTLADIMVQKGYVSDYEMQEIAAQLAEGAEAGTTVHGYQVLLELDHERPGRLYKAYQRAMDRTVLLRVLSKQVPEEAELIPGLKREAKLVAKMQHPGVVAGYDAGETDEEYFLVSEFVEGIKLSQLIELEGSLGEEETLKIALKIIRAMEYLEEREIIHRDIEPENILVSKSGEAKLSSFSLAVSGDQLSDAAAENTQTATPFYMSPEQAKGFKDLDVGSDLFSLGATMYHMLTGQAPFGTDPEMVLALIITKDTPDPRTLEPEILGPAAELVMKLMEKEQAQRYQGASEVRKRIEELLTAAGSDGPTLRPRKSARSRRQRVKHASKMLHAGASKPAPAPAPESARETQKAAPEAPKPSSEALKAKSEAIKHRSTATGAAPATGGRNTLIYGVIGLVAAVVIIIVAVSNMPSGKPSTNGRTRYPDRTAGTPEVPGMPGMSGMPGAPKVSDVQQDDLYPEDVKKFKELKRQQLEFPDSPALIAKYDEFLKVVKDPGIKKVANEARYAVISNYYDTATGQARKLRLEHKYAEAIALYQKLLSVIPESQKTPIEQVGRDIDRSKAESDAHFSLESSKAEGLLDRGHYDAALIIYEKLNRTAAKENAELAAKIVERLKETKTGSAIPEEPVALPDPVPGEGPDTRSPEEIEAEEKKERAQARLQAMKMRIVAEAQAQVAEHISALRIPMAKRALQKSLKETKNPEIADALHKIEKHIEMVEKCMKALDACMEKLYKKNIIELWLKKRQVLLGELIRYEAGTLIFKKRNNETVKIRLSDLREDEVERYLLEGFGEKSPETLLNIAVFFVYFFGEHELTTKYLGLAQAGGADVNEYMNLLRGTGFETSLMDAEEDFEKKRFFEAYMKLCRLKADYAQAEPFKLRKEYIEKITGESFKSSGLGRLFVGKLEFKPPILSVSYDFIHSSQLNDFKALTWDKKSSSPESEIWRLEDNMLAGGGDALLVWKGAASEEFSVSFFAEPVELGFFEILVFADPEKPYQNKAYAFGFHAAVDENEKNPEPEHYIALWDGKKETYKYLKRGIMKPALEEKKTYLVQIIARKGVLQLFVGEKLLGELKDSTLDKGTIALRVSGALVRFDNLEIKAGFEESWLRKAAKGAK